jgi:hypothetical protein
MCVSTQHPLLLLTVCVDRQPAGSFHYSCHSAVSSFLYCTSSFLSLNPSLHTLSHFTPLYYTIPLRIPPLHAILLTSLYYNIPQNTPLCCHPSHKSLLYSPSSHPSLNVPLPSLIFHTFFYHIIYLLSFSLSQTIPCYPYYTLPLFTSVQYTIRILYHPFSIAHFTLLSQAFEKLTLSVILSLTSPLVRIISFHTHCKSFVPKLDLMFVLILFVNTYIYT